MRITVALTKMFFSDRQYPEDFILSLQEAAKKHHLKVVKYYGIYYEGEDYGLNRGEYIVILDPVVQQHTTIFDNMFTEFKMPNCNQGDIDRFNKSFEDFKKECAIANIDLSKEEVSKTSIKIYSELNL